MMRNVLVFSGGSYPGIQIYFALKNNLRYNVIAASSYSDHSAFVYKEYYEKLPYVYEIDFLSELNRLINVKNIDFIIPTHDTITYELMKNEDKINAIIVASPFKTAEICRFKSKTYSKFIEYSFCPERFRSFDEIKSNDYPIFMKPDQGQGSRGILKISNNEEFSSILSRNTDLFSDYVLTEYLPGEEITIDCFTNYKKEILFINPRLRERVMNGISSRYFNIELTSEVKSIVLKINELINMRGYWFIQLKKDKRGNFKLLEISTRFAGTVGLSLGLDVNLPLLALDDFMKKDVIIHPNSYKIVGDKTYIDRYKIIYEYDTVFIDFDDTITMNNGSSVNWQVMSYIYQLKNREKKLILITKHLGEKVHNALERLCISSALFDQIIQIEESDEKYTYMTQHKSIFIDNSFNERIKVKKKLQIPTFDTNNIDHLIDWSD